MQISRADLKGCRVRVLNIGGRANPDVLQVRSRDGSLVVVKDYARRGAFVRRHLAGRLIDRELAMIRRVQGVPGVPAEVGRIDALAFALEWIEGQPLRRRSHRAALPEGFFVALESMLEAIRERGLFYADLRSPTNVLCTRHFAPALVDWASAIRLRVPRAWSARLHRRALVKLRARFEKSPEDPNAPWLDVLSPAISELRSGRDRVRRLDLGPLGVSPPILWLLGGERSLEQLRPILEAGASLGHRIIGIEVDVRSGSDVETRVGWLQRVLGMLRLDRVALVAHGTAAELARAAAEGQVTSGLCGLLTRDDGEWMLALDPNEVASEKSFALELWQRHLGEVRVGV